MPTKVKPHKQAKGRGRPCETCKRIHSKHEHASHAVEGTMYFVPKKKKKAHAK